MGNSEIMREYLVRLGYQTDVVSLRRFEDNLGKTSKRLLKVSTAVTGIVATIGAATTAFSYSMRKMYFTSQLANSSVKNLNAMSYAGKQIGISGDSMESMIKSMGMMVRLNPGIKALAQNLGIDMNATDTSDQLMQLMTALKSQPEYIGSQFAEMFGIDKESFLLMIDNMEKFKQKQIESKKIWEGMGVDIDASKETILKYTSTLDKMGEKSEAIGAKVLTTLVPVFDDLAGKFDEATDALSKFLAKGTDASAGEGFLDQFKQWYFTPSHLVPTKKDLSEFGNWFGEQYAKGAGDFGNRVKGWVGATVPQAEANIGNSGTAVSNENVGPTVSNGLFSNLENKYNLPSGLLDKVWKTESGRGKNMKSSKGALGHFQFMPDTAKEFGLKNPFDLEESADAAARKYQGLLKRYRGDTRMAAAAYNWGEGNIADWQAGKKALPSETQNYMNVIGGKGNIADWQAGKQDMPSETRNYMNSIGGARLGVSEQKGTTLNQTTTINVQGNGAEVAAKAVAREQNEVNRNLVRNFPGIVQ